MKNLFFLENPHEYKNPSEFISILSDNIGCKKDLLNDLSKKLKFPDYFGYNWDALYDCLRDFHWIDKKGIVLIHKDLPKLERETFKIYLDILVSSVNDWKEGEKHYFKVFFPIKYKNFIEQLLNELSE